MAKESTFWGRLQRGLAQYGDLVRVENSAGPGTPDLNYCLQGTEGWAELKYANDYHARDTTRVFGAKGLRVEQVVWAQRRLRAGGRVYILCQVGKDIYCLNGIHAPRFNDYTRGELLAYAQWAHHGNMTPADWCALKNVLTS